MMDSTGVDCYHRRLANTVVSDETEAVSWSGRGHRGTPACQTQLLFVAEFRVYHPQSEINARFV